MHRLIQEQGADSPLASILTHLKLTVTVRLCASLTNSGADEHPRPSKRKLKVVVAMVPTGGTCAHRKSACGGRQDGRAYSVFLPHLRRQRNSVQDRGRMSMD